MKPLLAALLLLGPAAVAQPAPPLPSADSWQQRGTAELSLLDKVRAQPSTVQVPVGQSVPFHSLTILVRGCVARPPSLPQDSAAFLEITDSRAGGNGFRGWMLAGAPAVSQLEHPLYDVRVMACR